MKEKERDKMGVNELELPKTFDEFVDARKAGFLRQLCAERAMRLQQMQKLICRRIYVR